MISFFVHSDLSRTSVQKDTHLELSTPPVARKCEPITNPGPIEIDCQSEFIKAPEPRLESPVKKVTIFVETCSRNLYVPGFKFFCN